MTDKELIRALRKNTLVIGGNVTIYDSIKTDAADRLEALLAENEHLREITKMVPHTESVTAHWDVLQHGTFSTEPPSTEEVE